MKLLNVQVTKGHQQQHIYIYARLCIYIYIYIYTLDFQHSTPQQSFAHHCHYHVRVLIMHTLLANCVYTTISSLTFSRVNRLLLSHPLHFYNIHLTIVKVAKKLWQSFDYQSTVALLLVTSASMGNTSVGWSLQNQVTYTRVGATIAATDHCKHEVGCSIGIPKSI